MCMYYYIYWASFVAQMVKNMPKVQETPVQSLSQENPWRKEWLPTLVFLPGKSHGQRNLEGYSPWGSQRVRHNRATNIFTTNIQIRKVRFQKGRWLAV